MKDVATRRTLGTWGAIVVVVAAVMTTLDALLLQAKRAFFTGGFLAADHLRSHGDAVLFIALSYVGDLAVVGILAAIGLMLAKWCGLAPRATFLLTAAVPLLSLAAADVIAYQLLAHLGDAFDLGLMFDLTGQSTAELLAVSAAQLTRPGIAIAVGLLALALVIFGINRHERRRGSLPPDYRLRRLLPATIALLVMGILATTSARMASAEFDNGLRRKPSTRLLGSVVDFVSDVDRDGFGVLRAPADPAPTDARIYPYAIDVPGNGIDENGIGGDAPTGYPPYEEPPPPAVRWPTRPDVVFVVLESFRADVLGAVQRDKAVTPVMNGLAERGIRVDAAYSHNGYTAQSRHHLMTGSLAGLHGDQSLIDDFKAQGYQVGYFSGQDDSFGGAALSVGADRAHLMFDARQAKSERYSAFSTPGSLAVTAATVLTRVRAFLEARPKGAPLFLYVNFHDTHYPYRHDRMPRTFADRPLEEAAIVPANREALRVTYYNAASYVDSAIGELLADVNRSTGRSSSVIIVGDHGESLFDDTFLGHGYALNDPQTRIPLIATDIALAVRKPFGQSDLRESVVRALGRNDPQNAPTARTDNDKRVFQYLGTIGRPRQIALTSSAGRIVYDFRSNKVCFDATPCVSATRLDRGQEREFLDLVHRWEAIVLARSESALQDQ